MADKKKMIVNAQNSSESNKTILIYYKYLNEMLTK